MSSDCGTPVAEGPCQNAGQAVPLAREWLPGPRRPHAPPASLGAHGRLPEVVGPGDSEIVSGLVVEVLGSVPSSEEERLYLAPSKCG